MDRTFIIAEAGVNHNGSVEIALRLIDEAKTTGADCIKFQTFSADKIVTRLAEKAKYQLDTTTRNESQYEMLRKLELSEKDHRTLFEYAKKRSIMFLSSPFDEESVDMLDCLGISIYKIGSGELTNHPLLVHVARKKKPIILSTGMSTLDEVKDALEAIYSVGNISVTLLHCVTEYPAPFEEINLRAMLTMRAAFRVPVGYSDHTQGTEISIAAVALGAKVIEKHFTLNRKMEGPDHRASLEPSEFGKMVVAIRNTEAALGSGIKKPAPCEMSNISVARKSIIASRRILAGETITASTIVIKRPGYGIAPSQVGKVLGCTAAVNIEPEEVIRWEYLRK
jgi:N-acetylneuraminate synthase